MQAKEDYQVNNYTPSDFETYHQFCRDTEMISPLAGIPTNVRVAEKLRRPKYDPGRHLFVAKTNDAIVGHLDITAEPGIDRALFECFVHPQHRNRGLGSTLLQKALGRMEEEGIGRAQFNLLEDNKYGQEFLVRRGFSHIRGFLELRARVEDVNWQCPPTPSGLTYRSLQAGEEATLAALQNQCFTGSWGFHPNTEEDIIYMTTLGGHSLEDIIVAEFDEKMVAYCWVTRNGQEPKGRIHMIGVDPDYRGMRLGKGVLLAGLHRLKEQGIAHLEVTVDSQNPTAYRLYQATGFGVWKISLWYQKRLGDTT